MYRFLLAWALLGLACGNRQRPVPTDEDAIDTAALCAWFVLSAQNGLDLCTASPPINEADVTADGLGDACRPGSEGMRWSEAVVDSATRGQLDITFATLEACRVESQSLRARSAPFSLFSGNGDDATAWQTLEARCNASIQGSGGPSVPCHYDWDCQDGLVCALLTAQASDRLCLPPSGVDQGCNAGRPCADGLRCNAGGMCTTLVAAGGGCRSGVECLSGRCSGRPLRCAPSLVPIELGATCIDNVTSCDAFCARCLRDAPTETNATCSLLQAEGSYCASSLDCVTPLVCVDDQCVAVDSSLPEPTGSCNANSCTPTCRFDAECSLDAYCDVAAGTCEPLPASCQSNTGCPDTAYCVRLGADCSSITTQVGCEVDSTCTWVNETCEDAGVGFCARRLEPGDTCDPRQNGCRTGSCRTVQPDVFQCAPFPTEPERTLERLRQAVLFG